MIYYNCSFCDNLRKSAVKYLLFFRSPVVSGPAFAAYCSLPAVLLAFRLCGEWPVLNLR